MRIDGTAIADTLLTALTEEVRSLRESGIVPTLAVVLVGDDPASLAYIRQKQKAADRIGAVVLFSHLPADTSPETLSGIISEYNRNPNIHGLIVQRPVPESLGDVQTILSRVSPVKDVDGFLSDSPYDVPVALAVGEILESVYGDTDGSGVSPTDRRDRFLTWLRTKHIIVIGRGKTAGEPILRYFQHLDCATSQIISTSPDPDRIIASGDIIISCVGKAHIVNRESVNKNSILISVGIWRDEAGKLRGDYDEADIANLVSAYTPTPGGVGPVNVACLMQNLIKACTITIRS